MKFGPLFHQGGCTTGQAATDNVARRDLDLRFFVAVRRMKMGRRMIYEIHRDPHAVKPRQLGHLTSLCATEFRTPSRGDRT